MQYNPWGVSELELRLSCQLSCTAAVFSGYSDASLAEIWSPSSCVALYTLRGSARWPKGNPQWHDQTVYVSNVCGYYHNIPQGIPRHRGFIHDLLLPVYLMWRVVYILWSTTVLGNTYQGSCFNSPFGKLGTHPRMGAICWLCCTPTLENQIWREPLLWGCETKRWHFSSLFLFCLHAVGETGRRVWILLYVMPPVQVIEKLTGRIPGFLNFLFFGLYWQEYTRKQKQCKINKKSWEWGWEILGMRLRSPGNEVEKSWEWGGEVLGMRLGITCV